MTTAKMLKQFFFTLLHTKMLTPHNRPVMEEVEKTLALFDEYRVTPEGVKVTESFMRDQALPVSEKETTVETPVDTGFLLFEYNELCSKVNDYLNVQKMLLEHPEKTPEEKIELLIELNDLSIQSVSRWWKLKDQEYARLKALGLIP